MEEPTAASEPKDRPLQDAGASPASGDVGQGLQTANGVPVRSWTLARMAVLGGCFGAGLAVTLAGTLYLFGVYNSRPKPWDDKALTVQWNDLRYLVGQDEVVAGFLFQYGIRNNTSRDYRLTKSGITIMERSVFQPQTLEPAVFNLSIGREDGYFLPAQRTSLIELTYEGSCNPSESREVCFDNHTKELHDLVLLDDGLRYQINLPKPQRKKH